MQLCVVCVSLNFVSGGGQQSTGENGGQQGGDRSHTCRNNTERDRSEKDTISQALRGNRAWPRHDQSC